MTRHRTGFAAILVLALCCVPKAHPDLGAQPAQTLDAVLTAYIGGDFDIVKRTFVRSPDFHRRLRPDRPRDLDRWLGAWDRGKALLLLEVARASATVAPHLVSAILDAGRRFVATAPAAPNGATDFVHAWHRAAAGVLQGASGPALVERYIAEHGAANSGVKDARLVLAYAIAQERRCWADRPSLSQQAVRIDALLESAGARVPDDPGGPFKSGREAASAKHSACLREAVSRFERAATLERVAAEALVRGGWVLIQDGRPKEAFEWLDAARPDGDRDLDYWRALFRGRALEALARSEEAAEAYREALVLFPRAQSAGLGLSIALMRLDRTAEADEISRSVREAGSLTPDPWIHYTFGDERFVGRWIDSLRTVVR